MKVIKFVTLLLIILIFANSVLALDSFEITSLLSKEIKKSSLAKEVQIGQIRFIGYEPRERCQPENLSIREIKRPNSVEFTFKCGKGNYRAIANYEILTNVYVTQMPIKRGETISEEKIVEIKQPISKLPVGAITDKSLLIGKITKRSLAKGLIIKEEYLYSNILLKKGSKVNIVVNVGQVMIMTEGVLKSDTIVGETARVECFQTGKEIVGKLIDKENVRVTL
ncbi:MAG: flagellar basal body P-ring formation chaperone FlgA [Thermodesulfovibrio sp.]|nr:flagellar basal body P-ring formation chaperone FlgA [Thermodesulfovibrio sp.]MDW7999025.1 flagellar basal body P-ring formation chaperone FlgA [Thermodesulfovibrio sp.]